MVEKKAVALKYQEQESSAPKVVAKGQGIIAEKIMQKADEFDVPIFQNKALAESLLNLDLDEQIPPNLYKAVAEVFVWLMKSEKKAQMSK
ncbi:MAG: EscU/YscU/HrcU family type III secretion system export apparatus switch protein [Epsilonproteobacteria bacterium]|nr:EscU/YscU/HrcU family type III secretion system export apparatus switch protein [Campylobacterota bacterium]